MTELASIGWLGLAASGILVAVAVGVSLWRRLGLTSSIVWACGRALVQLLIVGAALHLVVDDAPLVWSWLWVVVMIGFAAWTTQRRVGASARVLGLAVAAFTAAALVSLAVLFGLGVFDMTGRALVPLAGMMVGNSLSTTVLAAKRTLAEAHDHRAEIEARLALGMPARDAFAPHLRQAVRDALIPQIETTKAVGIIFLPGAMVGLILAGAEPAEAVKVQAAVMYLVLGSVATTCSVMALGLGRRLFTPDHRLRVPPASAARRAEGSASR
ncbi:MAG: iron export ABC transporter permease subunit FetB [Ilumatobacteraceae bacterium]